jgi:hypothetical protein
MVNRWHIMRLCCCGKILDMDTHCPCCLVSSSTLIDLFKLQMSCFNSIKKLTSWNSKHSTQNLTNYLRLLLERHIHLEDNFFSDIKGTKQIISVLLACELNTEDNLFQKHSQVHFREVLTLDSSPVLLTTCCLTDKGCIKLRNGKLLRNIWHQHWCHM